MQSLNLRDDASAPEDHPEAPPEEPLGLDLIRGWIAKPRPRLYRLWLWAPHTARGIGTACRWLGTNSGPALRRAAEQARKAAVVVRASRRLANRLAHWLRTTFPPGSRGHELASHLGESIRLLGQAALALVRTRRDLDQAASLLERQPAPPERRAAPESPPPAPESPPPAPESPPPRQAPAKETTVPAGRLLPRAADAPREEPRRQERRASAPTASAPAGPSRFPGVSPGPRADALAGLSTELRTNILTLGERPRKAPLRYAIWWILSECGATTSERLGLLLNVDAANLAKRHLSPLVEEGAVEHTIPDRLNHPDQAYRATRWPPGADRPPSVSE